MTMTQISGTTSVQVTRTTRCKMGIDHTMYRYRVLIISMSREVPWTLVWLRPTTNNKLQAFNVERDVSC